MGQKKNHENVEQTKTFLSTRYVGGNNPISKRLLQLHAADRTSKSARNFKHFPQIRAVVAWCY